MAPPTPDQIYDYLNALTNPVEGHIAYEWDELIDRTWRFHSTTSNAVDKRMRELARDGRLVAIRVDHSGLVFLPPDAERMPGIAAPYFVYHKPHRYSKDEYGTISLTRDPDRQNLWANGVRHLYMPKPAYEAMLTDLAARTKAKHERMRKSQADERARLKDALTALAPDAIEVLNRLRLRVPDLRVEPRLSTIAHRGVNGLDGPETVNLAINVYDQAAFLPLLDIIRRGLQAEPGEPDATA